jgi:DNA-binding response OmpR family regulator
LTGWDQPSARARALAAGFDEHLIKPANARALRAVMAASQQRRVLLALGTGEYPTMR